MAVDPHSDPLERALVAAREEQPPEGWADVADSVMSRVRGLVVPSEPVLVHVPDDASHAADGSTTRVATRVLRQALRRRLSRPTYVAEGLDLAVEDERLVGVTVRLVCSYGVPLPDLAAQVRAEVLDELGGWLGPDPALVSGLVAVEVVDVVVGDPRLV